MIHMPRRSVTRFFIPLIDVMILLFCIFLLMPVFKEADPENPDNLEKAANLKEIRDLKAELKRLSARQKLPFNERVSIRVLEIDPTNGKLFYYEPGRPPKRREIASAEAASELIDRQKAELKKRAFNARERPELYYLILMPRVDSGFPQEGQLEAYKLWFKGIGHVEKPGASL